MSITRLFNWYIDSRGDHFIARGVVVDHPTLMDSIFVRTSPIKDIVINLEANLVSIRTLNTEYNCDMQDASIGDLLIFQAKFENKQNPEYINILLNNIVNIVKCIKNKPVYRANPHEVHLILGNNCNYYFHSMIVNDGSDEIVVDKPDIHVGTFQDSVLCRVDDVDIRYFPYRHGCVSFYSFDVPEYNVKISNTGTKDMVIEVFGNKYRLESGESKDFSKDDLIKPKKHIEPDIKFNDVDLYSYWLDDNGNKLGDTE